MESQYVYGEQLKMTVNNSKFWERRSDTNLSNICRFLAVFSLAELAFYSDFGELLRSQKNT